MLEHVKTHRHTGVDAPRVYGKDLNGFLVLNYHPTTATWPSREGCVVLSDDGATVRANVMVNGAVYFETLTAA